MSRPREWRDRSRAKAEVVVAINDGMECPHDGSWCRQPECRADWCLSQDFDTYTRMRETTDAHE